MITCEPTNEQLREWETVWRRYKDRLQPNRRTGDELVDYLADRYVLTAIDDPAAAAAVSSNVTMNLCNAEKLPAGAVPVPKVFYLENAGNGERFYAAANKDPEDLWGGDITRIFVGVDTASGFFMVEGSTMLADELCAFQGLDEMDLQNYVCVSQYIFALERFGRQGDLPTA